MSELTLCHLDLLLLGHPAILAHHLDNLSPLPSHAAEGIWIDDHGHVLPCLLFDIFGSLAHAILDVVVGCRFDFILEDVVLDLAVHVAVEELLPFFGVVEVEPGERIVLFHLFTPAFEQVPFAALLRERS